LIGQRRRRALSRLTFFRSAQLETIQALVHSGVGISLIPEMAARKKRAGLPEYRSLVSPKPERKIVAIWPKQRPLSRAANELLNQFIAKSKEL
jgi:LysR family hydrogen peroxide-inducible transcriptional activator